MASCTYSNEGAAAAAEWVTALSTVEGMFVVVNGIVVDVTLEELEANYPDNPESMHVQGVSRNPFPEKKWKRNGKQRRRFK